jgi:hypothetical protein
MTTLWAIVREKSNREIISWLGGGAVIVIGGLWALFVYVFPPMPPDIPENLELSGVQTFLKTYGDSAVSIVDVNVKNRGGRTDNVEKIKLNIKNVFQYNYNPCQNCFRTDYASGVYNIHFKDVVKYGANEFFIAHTIPPGSIEKIQLVLGGNFNDNASYLARITITVFTGSGKILESQPVDVLVQNFDLAEESPINASTESELRKFIDFGANAPEIINADVVRRYFASSNTPSTEIPHGRVHLPPLPAWFANF